MEKQLFGLTADDGVSASPHHESFYGEVDEGVKADMASRMPMTPAEAAHGPCPRSSWRRANREASIAKASRRMRHCNHCMPFPKPTAHLPGRPVSAGHTEVMKATWTS